MLRFFFFLLVMFVGYNIIYTYIIHYKLKMFWSGKLSFSSNIYTLYACVLCIHEYRLRMER